MPEALALLPLALGASVPFDLATGTGVIAGSVFVGGVSIGSSALFTTVSGIAISVGLSYAANLFTTKQSMPSQATQVTLNDSTTARVRGYGRCLLGGGRLIWDNVSGSPAHRLTAMVHSQGPVDAIEAYWFNDEIATFSLFPSWRDPQSPSTPMGGNCELCSWPGTGSQDIGDDYIGAVYPIWTAGDKGRGLFVTALEYNSVATSSFTSTYKNGEPTVRVVARTSLVYDPRDGTQTAIDTWDNPSTWKWSDNAGLCILDYLRHPDGRDIDISRIDVSTFDDFANLCDEQVALKHGGTESRYRIGGTYQLNDEPTGVMSRLLATCDAELYRTAAGLIGIRGGEWVDSTLTFQGDAILGYSLTQGAGKMVAFNRTTITYTSPQHDYQAVEADPWIDYESEAAIGSLPTALQLDMVISNAQARRIAKINAAKANPEWKGTISLDITGLNALTERVIRVVLPDDDLDLDATFLVTKAQIASDLTRVDLTVVSLSADAYAWDPDTEEGEAPPLVTTLTTSGSVVTPSGLAAVAATGPNGAYLQTTVTPPADTTLFLIVQWSVSGAGEWSQGTPEQGLFAFNTGVVGEGVSYDVRARFAANSTVQSAWTSTVTVAVPASGGQPPPPTALYADAFGSRVEVGAVAPYSSLVADVAFWRSSGPSFSGAARIATISCGAGDQAYTTDHPGSGTWYYWATAESSVPKVSTPAGYVSATI